MNTLFTVIKENLNDKSFNPDTEIIITSMTPEGFDKNSSESEKLLDQLGLSKNDLAEELGKLTYSDYVNTEVTEINQNLKKTYLFKKTINDKSLLIKLRSRCSCNGNRFFVELQTA